MTFGNLLTVVFFGYILYYAGMISYDQFFKKDELPLEAAVEEEEIDISSEAAEFHPKDIVKDKKKELTKEEESEQEVMSGGIEIEELIPKVDELAEKGKDCPFGKPCRLERGSRGRISWQTALILYFNLLAAIVGMMPQLGQRADAPKSC